MESASNLFPPPVVRGSCRGIPILSFGFADVLAQSPDLADDTRIQQGNNSPCTKLKLKKSSQIERNHIGLAIGRMPRTSANDYMPLEPVNLIDGNPETCWCSGPYPQPDAEPVWIRIDLAMERTVSKIVLRTRTGGPARNVPGSAQMDSGAMEVGKAMAGELTIKISRDAQHWETVFDGPTPNVTEFTFDPRPAKQIWVIARKLPRVENWGHSFSIANVEVCDVRGNNVALVTNGAGATASSTMHGFGTERDAYPWYWAMNYDIGAKWVRLGFHDDVINWHWVEKEKGKLQIDPVADEAISDLVRNGVDVMLALGFGNRHYTQKDPARRLPQLWEWYWENPAPPTTPEALEAWERYVRFMAEHFKDRVKIFEVWNEWNTPGYWGADVNAEQYIEVVKRAIPILRKVAPNAKIMLGAIAGFVYRMHSWSDDERARQEREHPALKVVRALAKDVDMISWHPFYQSPPTDIEVLKYAEDVAAFQRYCESHGFRGSYMVTEWAYGASYPPPAPPNWWGTFVCSEMEKAKYIARLTVEHAALDLTSFFCGFLDSYYPLDLSLGRRGFLTDPLTRMQPQASYYVMRNLATALENVKPASLAFHVTFARPSTPALTMFAMSQGDHKLLALWIPGLAKDICEGYSCDVIIDGDFRQALGIDPLNGVEQPLNLQKDGHHVRLAGILVHDYPLLIRLSP